MSEIPLNKDQLVDVISRVSREFMNSIYAELHPHGAENITMVSSVAVSSIVQSISAVVLGLSAATNQPNLSPAIAVEILEAISDGVRTALSHAQDSGWYTMLRHTQERGTLQ